MQRKDGEREREYAGEDGDAEDVHIVLLGGISPDDGVDAEESREQGIRRGGEQGFKQEMRNAERDVLPQVYDKTYGAVDSGSDGKIDSEKHEPPAERFYNFINFLRGHSKYLLTNLAVKKAIMNNT